MMVASVMMPKSLRSGRRSKRGWSWISGRLCEVPLELVLVFLKTIMATLDKEINFGQFLLRLTLKYIIGGHHGGKVERRGRKPPNSNFPNEIWRRRRRIIRSDVVRTFWSRWRMSKCVSFPPFFLPFRHSLSGPFIKDVRTKGGWGWPKSRHSKGGCVDLCG